MGNAKTRKTSTTGLNMIPRIQSVAPMKGYQLLVIFDGGQRVVYDVSDDIRTIPDFSPLKDCAGLFDRPELDSSRTSVFWNDRIDLPSDTLLEYGVPIKS